MAKALFISENYLKSVTAISANVDVRDLLPFVEQAQDIHIQDALGSKLYDALMQAIVDSNVSADRAELLEQVRPCLAYYAMHAALPFINFKVRNVGVVKQQGENTQNADLGEMKYLRGEVKDTAEYYLRRLNRYLCNESSKFPEYRSPDAKGVLPGQRDYTCDLYLDELPRTEDAIKKIMGNTE